jgi:hypothetical protein
MITYSGSDTIRIPLDRGHPTPLFGMEYLIGVLGPWVNYQSIMGLGYLSKWEVTTFMG